MNQRMSSLYHTKFEYESSVLTSYAYKAIARTLELRFTSNRIYQYQDVPKQVADELSIIAQQGWSSSGLSAGEYYNSEIKGVFSPAENVTDWPEAPFVEHYPHYSPVTAHAPRPTPDKLCWGSCFCQHVAVYGEWSAVVLELPGGEASLLLYLNKTLAHSQRGFADVRAAKRRVEEILLPD